MNYSDDTPISFGGWSGWNIWQFTQSAVIAGYTGMDLSWCPSLDVITPPKKVINLTGSNISKGTVKLSWNKNTEVDLRGYNIYRDGVLVTTTKNNSITINGLKAGKTYKFGVQAVDRYYDVSKTLKRNIYISK